MPGGYHDVQHRTILTGLPKGCPADKGDMVYGLDPIRIVYDVVIGPVVHGLPRERGALRGLYDNLTSP